MNKWFLKYNKQNKLIEKKFVGYVISFSHGMSFPDGNIHLSFDFDGCWLNA